MIDNRLELHAALVDVLGHGNIYFQPPSNVRLTYPCVVYELADIDSRYADNIAYRNMTQYTLTYISKDPDDEAIRTLLSEFTYISFTRFFVADNLNHYIYKITI